MQFKYWAQYKCFHHHLSWEFVKVSTVLEKKSGVFHPSQGILLITAKTLDSVGISGEQRCSSCISALFFWTGEGAEGRKNYGFDHFKCISWTEM